MSPEQTRMGSLDIDTRTDIYSLGVVLYRMLTGRLPFYADTIVETLRRVVEETAQPPRQLVPDLPAELERICLKAMAKRIESRYTTALDMTEDLRGVCRSAVTSAPLVADNPDSVTKVKPPTLGPRQGIETERRRITLLICNCDSTDPDRPLELLDPEEQHGIQIAFHRRCADVIQRFGGTPVPSAAREVFVCFGFPIAHEDAAARAVRTGLALIEAVSRLGAEQQAAGSVPISAWVTVHTGQAVVGEGNAAKGEVISIVGEVRNVVTRLEPYSEPGFVLVTETTQQLTRGYFVSESRGKQAIKGVPQPLEMFRILGESAAKTRLDVSEQAGLTPLVGRDTELSILRDRWEQTSEGMGQVVLLIGEAGLGKSRLVRELKSQVVQESAAGEFSVIEWQCSTYHQNSSLNPATDYLERLLCFVHEDAPAERFHRLEKHLKELGPTQAETVSLFAALLSLPTDAKYPPLNLSPQKQREKTHEALLDWLRACARKQPVLFIIEDLHWIDPSSLELLSRLVEQGFNDRILTLLTFRPEFETPWKSKAHQTQIALNRLTKRQIAEMIRQKVGRDRVPQTVIDEVAVKSDGIPLFVEEFTKVLTEAPSVQDAEGDSMASMALRLQEIPATLEDLLMARLDHMASNREVVQLGATLGREFGYELLHAVCSLEETALQAELDKLVQAEMLFQKGRPPQCSYLFKHALIQDAAYKSMLKKKRQQYHGKIAEGLVARFAETAATEPELVAQHYTEAGQSEQGIEYWLRAGQRAGERADYQEAIRHLSRGLDLLNTLPPAPTRDGRELAFRLQLASCYLATRGYASSEVETHVVRARELCEHLGAVAPLFGVMMITWALRFIRGKNALAQKICAELLNLAEASNDEGCRTEAHWAWGCTTWWAGDFAKSRNHLERGYQSYKPEAALEHVRFTAQNSGPLLLAYSGLALWSLGYFDQARAKAAQAVAFAERLNHPFSTAASVWQTGFMSQLAGDGPAALAVAEKVQKLSEEQSFAFWIALPLSLRGAALSLMGRHAEAVPLLQDGLRRVEATGCEMVHQNNLGCLADALWQTGRRHEAWAALNRAFALTERDQERYIESELYRRKAAFLADESPAKVAEITTCLETAIAIARRQEARFFELRSTLALARLRLVSGGPGEARGLVQPLVDWFTEGFDAPDLVRAREFLETLS